MYANMCRNCLNWDIKKHICKEGWASGCCGAGFDAIVDTCILRRRLEKYDKIEVIFNKDMITFKYYKNDKIVKTDQLKEV